MDPDAPPPHRPSRVGSPTLRLSLVLVPVPPAAHGFFCQIFGAQSLITSYSRQVQLYLRRLVVISPISQIAMRHSGLPLRRTGLTRASFLRMKLGVKDRNTYERRGTSARRDMISKDHGPFCST